MRKIVSRYVLFIVTIFSCLFILVGQALSSTFVAITSSGTISYSPQFPFRVEGKQIVDALGNPVFLRGCAKMGFEYANPVTRTDREVNPNYYDYDVAVISSWGANLMRVSFAGSWYNNSLQYRAYLRQWVDTCASKGLYIIMDCHYPSPMESLIRSDTPENEANTTLEGIIAIQEQVVQDYAEQPMVIGVEINEPWLMDDHPDKQWNWLLRINNFFAQRIHAINPNMLIFIDIANLPWTSDAVIDSSKSHLTEPNLVLAPHIYEAERGFPYHGKYYPDDGSNFITFYEQGAYQEGKRRFNQYLDLYYKQVFDLYGLPFVITEFAGNRDLTQPLEDLMEYFNNHVWCYSYWTYHGGIGSYLLEEDWQTLSPTGSVFVQKLYKE